jgi:hypothetical protein
MHTEVDLQVLSLLWKDTVKLSLNLGEIITLSISSKPLSASLKITVPQISLDNFVPWLMITISVGDQHVFGPPRSGSISQRYRSGSGSIFFPFLIKVLSGLKKCLQNKISTKNFSKKLNF